MKNILLIVSKIAFIVFLLAFSIIMIAGEIMFNNRDQVSALFGQQTQIIEQDPNAANEDLEYYKSAFKNVKEVIANGERLAESIEAEGAVLLKNSNKAGKPVLPLKENAKVSLFSTSSVDPILGGTGSGQSFSGGVAFSEALGAAGLEVNQELDLWYQANLSKYGRKALRPGQIIGAVSSIGDAAWDEIDTTAKTEKADAAVFVLSRVGGEGVDSTIFAKDNKANVFGNDVTFDYKDGNYLKLNDTERNILENLIRERDAGTFGSVIVLMNTTNQVQLDFMDDLDIDAALWIGSIGSTGAYAVGDILAGNVNPSGKLSDTFWKKHYLNPVHANFGILTSDEDNPIVHQTQMVRGNQLRERGKHVVYQEGIYMGYRYTETRYEDKVLGTENAGEFNYTDTVSYPFGYGLSYTTFEYSDFKAERVQKTTANELKDSVWNLSVTVENTGDVAGKEAVQMYLQKPYTQYDKENGIEKAAVELVGFDKTKILAPGEKQTLTVTVEENAFASYDSYKAKTYIVDAGDYYFTAAANAHDAVNNILAAKGKTTADGMTENGDSSMVKKYEVKAFDGETYSKSLVTGNEITNRFDDVDLNIYDTTGANHVDYVTRDNWAGTVKFGLDENNVRTSEHVKITVTEHMIKDLDETWQVIPEESKGGEYPTFGSTETKYTLAMMREDSEGNPIPYDHPLWEDLLDQVTWDEMLNVLEGCSGYITRAIPSVAKPIEMFTEGGNGPKAGVGSSASNSYYGNNPNANRGLAIRTNDPDKNQRPITYPSNSVAASTFNKKLANYYGRQWGEDCLWSGTAGLFGMGMNIHRSPYSGRNFEYFSEDAVLVGQIAGEMVKGMATRGAYTYLKHCVINDQETYRCGIFTWANEQTIREVYLRAFQIAIEDGGALSVMTSLNSMGIKWSGSHGFVNTVLRGEFGMLGPVVTDTLGAHNGEFSRGLFYGNDLALGTYPKSKHAFAAPVSEGGTGEYGYYAQAMRESIHRILYANVRTMTMNGISSSDRIVIVTPPWMYTVTGLQITFGILFGLSVIGFAATVFLNRKKYFEVN